MKKMTKHDICRSEFYKISEKKSLTPENIVDEAKDKNNPLHQYFDWNNNSAGHKHRLDQARQLINYVIESTPDEDGKKIYSYEIVNVNNHKEYKHINQILSNKEWRLRIAEQAKNQLIYWKSKYQRYNIEEFRKVMQEITNIEKKTNSILTRKLDERKRTKPVTA